jgi:O-antigen/teichoic acid export membrane protein
VVDDQRLTIFYKPHRERAERTHIGISRNRELHYSRKLRFCVSRCVCKRMSAATNISQNELELLSPSRIGESVELRSRIGNISRQSFVYFGGTMLTAAAGYFFKVYLARKLGAEALGLYALGMTLVGFAGLFNSLGLPNAATRFVSAYSAKGERHKLAAFFRGSLGILVSLNLLLGAVFLSCGPWLAARFYHAPKLAPYLWAFAVIMFVGVLTMFLGQVLAGYRKVARRTLATHFIGTPANILIAVVLISLGFGLRGYLIAQVAGSLLTLCLFGIFLWKMLPREVRSLSFANARLERDVVTFSAAAYGIVCLQFVLGQADTVVLGHYLRAREVGIYAVATAMVGMVSIGLDSVNQIFSPMISELHAAGRQQLLQQLYSILTKWILILTFPMAAAVIFFSRELMSVFGSAFEPGAVVVIIGTMGQLVNCAVGSVGYLLQMSGHQGTLIRIQAVNAVILVALNLLLVPRLGITGAALASGVATVLTNLPALIAVRKILELSPYHVGYLKLIAPAFVCVTFLFALTRFSGQFHRQWESAAAALVMAYVIFLGTFLLGGLDPADRIFARFAWEKVEQSFRRMAVA